MPSARLAIFLVLQISFSFSICTAHPGVHGTQRIAPNNQTVPLDVGTVPVIPEDQRVILKARVVNAHSGVPVPHRVRITDSQDRYYPPMGHTELGELEGHVDNATLEPDLVNRGNRSWAMIEDGTFTVHLRAIDGYSLRFFHGFEYEQPTIALNLSGQAGQTIVRTFKLKQGIDMQARGWMNADSHVHSLSPEGALRQMEIEDVDYTNLMFIGPEHPLYTRGLVTGKPNPVSTKDRIVYVSQEVRDMEQGHMTLMGMKDPIEPVLVYTGTGKTEPTPLPNEPLNWQVTQRMHDQDGLAFHAHFLFWPGHGSAVGGALNLLDGLEWTSTDIVNNNRRTRQGLVIPGYETKPTGTDSGKLYYRMLNCGVRLPLIGGTDKMSAARPIGSVARTYASVDEWSHDGLMNAIREGNTFVTNGPLLSLSANRKPIGGDLQFSGDGPFTVEVTGSCFTQRPINYLQIIQDGEVVYEVRNEDFQQRTRIEYPLRFEKSGWVALRAGHDTPDPEDWWGYTMAAHTSPIYVTVNSQPPANKDDASYLLARLDTTLRWAETEAIWSNPETRKTAIDSFQKARSFYRKAQDRTNN
ncbi:MAG: CehA/McbA family metallohydrolase [Verrucomicrobia bacterium]|nr:CehA/McbA family metallohydrolase [Verrucomicrobiota bacterium]MDA1066660.1 CehA/McbA family metallohydrolase [Verrucomicrobiota bacterium]